MGFRRWPFPSQPDFARFPPQPPDPGLVLVRGRGRQGGRDPRLHWNNSGLKKPALVHRVSVAGSTTAGAAPPAPAWVATLKDSVVAATGGPQHPMTQADKVWFNAFMATVFGLALLRLVASVW